MSTLRDAYRNWILSQQVEDCSIKVNPRGNLILTNDLLRGSLNFYKQFRRAGYRVCVDDFGSGYSALNSLIDYDFEVLKLGLEFLRTFDESPRAGVLIKHVVQVAHRVNIVPLQGGVERQEHFDFLREIGCEMAQGYFFARPMELADSRAATRAKGIDWESQDRCA